MQMPVICINFSNMEAAIFDFGSLTAVIQEIIHFSGM